MWPVCRTFFPAETQTLLSKSTTVSFRPRLTKREARTISDGTSGFLRPLLYPPKELVNVNFLEKQKQNKVALGKCCSDASTGRLQLTSLNPTVHSAQVFIEHDIVEKNVKPLLAIAVFDVI